MQCLLRFMLLQLTWFITVAELLNIYTLPGISHSINVLAGRVCSLYVHCTIEKLFMLMMSAVNNSFHAFMFNQLSSPVIFLFNCFVFCIDILITSVEIEISIYIRVYLFIKFATFEQYLLIAGCIHEVFSTTTTIYVYSITADLCLCCKQWFQDYQAIILQMYMFDSKIEDAKSNQTTSEPFNHLNNKSKN